MPLIDPFSPENFFLNQLRSTLASESFRISDEACVYLSGVLARPAYHREEGVQRLLNALGPRYLKARQSRDASLFREVGDQSLLLRGFWWQYAERRDRYSPGPEYYEDLGRRSYRLAAMPLSRELHAKFRQLCQVLALLWSHTSVHTNADLATLYGFWMVTGSFYAKTILERHGIPTNAQPPRQ